MNKPCLFTLSSKTPYPYKPGHLLASWQNSNFPFLTEDCFLQGCVGGSSPLSCCPQFRSQSLSPGIESHLRLLALQGVRFSWPTALSCLVTLTLSLSQNLKEKNKNKNCSPSLNLCSLAGGASLSSYTVRSRGHCGFGIFQILLLLSRAELPEWDSWYLCVGPLLFSVLLKLHYV